MAQSSNSSSNSVGESADVSTHNNTVTHNPSLLDRLPRRFWSPVISAMLFVGMGVAILTVRLFSDGRQQYEAAEMAYSSGEPWRKMVLHYENAAKTYFPGNPYSKRAFWRLSILAKSAQMRGDSQRARYIWEVIRRSAVSQRYVIQPFAVYEQEAKRQISLIRTGHPDMSGGDKIISPSAVWSVLLWFGLLTWIVGTAVCIFVTDWRRKLYPGAISALGLVLWILAAVLA